MYPAITPAWYMQRILEMFWVTMPREACHIRFGALSCALWGRVKKLIGRFCALYALWKAGTLPKVRASARAVAPPPPRPSPVKGEGELHPVDAGRIRPASVLPRGLRWMQGMLPQSAGVLAAHVSVLVESHPEVKVFVAECPQVGRVLRPLCRLAGLTAPDYLRLPKRVLRAGGHPSPVPSPRVKPGGRCLTQGEGDAKCWRGGAAAADGDAAAAGFC